MPEVIEAIQHARVATRILYVTAHPDDEGGSVGMLAYLSRGLGAEVALLSITRGEGGQNAIGPEYGGKLAILRSEELQAACRHYGVKLFFTRAPDFGYSKTPEETMRVWGAQAHDDMVAVIRAFRPHIIINNWGGVRGGHGHHVAAGILTGDVFDEFAKGKYDWKPDALLNVSRGGSGGIVVHSDEVSPVWGKTYNEIGLEGFVQHRTQGIVGFRNSPFFRGTRSLVPVSPREFDAASLAEPLVSLVRRYPAYAGALRPALEKADAELAAGRDAALKLDWPEAARHLALAGRAVADARRLIIGAMPEQAAPVDWELERVQQHIDEALAAAAGLRMDALADRSELVAGETFTVQAQAHCRPAVPCALGEMRVNLPKGMAVGKTEGNEKDGFKFTVAVEPGAKPEPRADDWMLPFPSPLVTVQQQATLEGYTFSEEAPVNAQRLTSTRNDIVPLALVPAATVLVEPRQYVVPRGRQARPLEMVARVHSYATSGAELTVSVEAPEGWRTSSPARISFSEVGDQLVRFVVTPPATAEAGSYELRAVARRESDGAEFRTSLEPLPSLPTRRWSEAALVRVRVLDLVVPRGLRIGYIAAENDPIPDVLRQIGVQVTMLDEEALAFSDLRRFDAIAVGIRAYELRADLIRSNQRLLDYVAAGGTLVVQYQRDNDWNRLKPAPYPASIGQPTLRVSDETVPVRLLAPQHPLLNAPNKITAGDFQGWIQERGLYFWGEFDARYKPLLGMNDPGERETNGSLVVARHGKGTYIYTGLSFFRELPEGVPGALRLFVNLLSPSKLEAEAKSKKDE